MNTFRFSPKVLLTTSLALVLCLTASSVVVACPNCKDGLATPDGQALAQGFGWSIIFMMGMPFMILGGLGGIFYWQIQSARSADPSPDSTTDVDEHPAQADSLD